MLGGSFCIFRAGVGLLVDGVVVKRPAPCVHLQQGDQLSALLSGLIYVRKGIEFSDSANPADRIECGEQWREYLYTEFFDGLDVGHRLEPYV